MPNPNQDQLDQLRHSAAHLLAAAVLDLYPGAKLAIGPSIENGFYYDIDFPEPISDTDLKSIEKRMKKLVNSWQEFVKHPVSKPEALKEFDNNPYKRELIEEFASSDQDLTVYQSGQFRDLCRGGHVDHPNQVLKHFKLLSLAGAYWRGSETNPMLTRIYGTAFFSQEELDAYLNQLEEAKKRDHKVLGPALDLFVFSPLVGPGLPLWTPKGTLLRNVLDEFVWQLRKERGYQKVEIPHITKKELYEASGHWDKFKDELFKIITREGHEFAMKPMNCPHHTQIYASRGPIESSLSATPTLLLVTAMNKPANCPAFPESALSLKTTLMYFVVRTKRWMRPTKFGTSFRVSMPVAVFPSLKSASLFMTQNTWINI